MEKRTKVVIGCVLLAALACLSASFEWTSPDVKRREYPPKINVIPLEANFNLNSWEKILGIEWYFNNGLIAQFVDRTFRPEPNYSRTLWWPGKGSLGIRNITSEHIGTYNVTVRIQGRHGNHRDFSRDTYMKVRGFYEIVWISPTMPDNASLTYCVGSDIRLIYSYRAPFGINVGKLTWKFKPNDGSGERVIATDNFMTGRRNYIVSPAYRNRVSAPDTRDGYLRIRKASKQDSGLYTFVLMYSYVSGRNLVVLNRIKQADMEILDADRYTSCVPGTRVEGNWTIFQRRLDGSLDFNRSWKDYQNGFGNENGEFWLGLNELRELVSQPPYMYELRIDLVNDRGERATARYSNFFIVGLADKYRLYYDNFIGGNAGDSLRYHRRQQFSTWDSDNDNSSSYNCALRQKGGWWYNRCVSANLNSAYVSNGSWYVKWDTLPFKLERTEMKIRPAL